MMTRLAPTTALKITALAALAALAFFFAPDVLAQDEARARYEGIQDAFRVQSAMWQGQLTMYARYLFFTLATIQFCYTNIALALKGGDISDFISQNVKFVLSTGIMLVFLLNSYDWSRRVVNSFMQAGATAVSISSGQGGAAPAITEIAPGSTFEYGLDVAFKIITHVQTLSPLGSGASMLLLSICALLIIVSFAFIAAMMMVALVESYIVIGGAALLLGFGGASWTSDIAKRTMMYAISVGAKLFVMQLIVGVAMGSVLLWTNLDPPIGFTDTLSLCGLVILIAIMAKMIPELIQGILSGVSVGGSGAMMSTIGAGIAAAAAGAAAVGTGGASLAGTGAAAAGSSAAGGAAAGGATSGAQGAAMFGHVGAGGALGGGAAGSGGSAGAGAGGGSAPLGPLGAMGRTSGSASSGGGAGSGAAGASSAPTSSAPSTSGTGTGSDKADGFNPQAAGVSGGKKPDGSGGGAGAGAGGGSGTASTSASSVSAPSASEAPAARNDGAVGSVDQPSSTAPAPSSDADSEPGAALSNGKSVAESMDAATDSATSSPQGGEASTLDERASNGSVAGHLGKMAGHFVDMGSGLNPNAAMAPIGEIGKGADEEEPAPMGNVSTETPGGTITGAGSTPAPITPPETSGVDAKNVARGAIAGFMVGGMGGAAVGAAAGAAWNPAKERAKAALTAAKARFGIEQGTDK